MIRARVITATRITAQRITASVINAGIGAVCRWFSNFNGTSSYAEMTSDIVLAGDFEVRFSLTPNNISGTQSFLGDDNGVDDFIGVAGFEKLFYRFSGVSTGTGLFVTSDEVNDIIIKRAGSSVSSLINGVEEVDTNAGAFTLNALGSRNGQNNKYFGQLSNLEIWEGGDSTTGTKIMNMAMDERYLNVHGEILYNNSAVVDAWYLGLMNAGSVSFSNIELDADFKIVLCLEELVLNYGSMISGGNLEFLTRAEGLGDRVSLSVSGRSVFIDGAFSRTEKNTIELARVGGVSTLITSTGLNVDVSSTVQADTVNVSTLGENIAGANPDYFEGDFYNCEITKAGTKVLDYNFQSLSNVIVNQAGTPSANLWDGSTAVATGESSVIDSETINVLSTGVNSQVSVAETVAGQDVLVQVTVEGGSLDNIICGDTTTEFTGWTNILDSFNQPIPNRFQTLTNNDTDFIVFKTNGVADVTLTGITGQTVEGYGVLNGTRNTDYEYKNDSPHAIGYNITTTQDPECAPAEGVWIDGVLYIDGKPWID